MKRAIRDLAAAGLLHGSAGEETVRPTRAALRFYELSEEMARWPAATKTRPIWACLALTGGSWTHITQRAG